jgi:hypothetical protein
MRILCPNCRRVVLETSEKFKPGGPYTSAMFAPHHGRIRTPNSFQYERWTYMGEHLPCPFCDNFFIDQRTGALLSEHGWIQRGQASVDESLCILNADGTIRTMTEQSRVKPLLADWERPIDPADWPGIWRKWGSGPAWGGAEPTADEQRKAIIARLKALGVARVHPDTGLDRLKAKLAEAEAAYTV